MCNFGILIDLYPGMSSKIVIEICAGSIESAIAASKGGAGRIELCSALSEGGLTPSTGTLFCVKNQLQITSFILIRPRSGDFNYSRAEFEVMKTDIVNAKNNGADGFVTGMLNTDGTVDSCRMAELVGLARPLPVTFHRAFDMTRDPFEALEEIIRLGCARILTSGQASNAREGAALIAELIRIAQSRICIMPGGGVNASNLQELVQHTGAREFHLSASALQKSRMHYRRECVSMGNPLNDEFSVIQTDPKTVMEICRLADDL